MRLIILLIFLSSCGSVQTINGIRIKPKQSPDIFIYVVSFGFGYYLGKNYFKPITK